jgi:hypothetical protein
MQTGSSVADMRSSVMLFQSSITTKELHETLDDRDATRYSSAIYDTANRKINSFPYGNDTKKSSNPSGPSGPARAPVGQPTVDLAALGIEVGDAKNRIRGATKEQIVSRMMSAAFEHVNNAKESKDPLGEFHRGAILFDNLEM